MQHNGAAGGLDEYLKSAPVEVQGLGPYFKALKWGVREVELFMNGCAKTKDGSKLLVGDALENEVLEAASASGSVSERVGGSRDNGGHVTTVDYCLSAAGRQYVRDVLAVHSFVEFTDKEAAAYNPHPVLKTFKSISDKRLLAMVADGPLLEVGPNIATAVARGVRRGEYMGLVPRLDSSDVERHVSSLRSVRLKLAKDGYGKAATFAAIDALKGSRSTIFSQSTLQDVAWGSKYMAALDSLYGVSLHDVVRAMKRCGTSRCVGNLVYPSGLAEFFFSSDRETAKGRIGQTEMLWEASRSEDSVEFFFDRSSTRPYRHRLSTLAEYYRAYCRDFKLGDEQFLFRRLSSSNEVVMEFVIDRVVVGDEIFQASVKPLYHFLGREKVVRLISSTVNVQFGRGDPRRVEPVVIEVGEDSFSRVLQERMIRGPGKLSELISFIRTNRVNIVHGGVRVSCDMPIAPDQLTRFAVAIDALGNQLDATAEMDIQCYEEFADKKGVCRYSEGAGKVPGVGQLIWGKLVESMADVGRVAVERTSSVVVERLPTEVIDQATVGKVVDTNCTRLRKAKAARPAVRSVSYDAVKALESWVAFLEAQGCRCERCVYVEQHEDDYDEYFDADDGLGVASEVLVSSLSQAGVSSSCEDSDIVSMCSLPFYDDPVAVETGSVIIGEARSAAGEYADILKAQMDARESVAKDTCRRMMSNGGLTQRNLTIMSTEELRHVGVMVGALGRVDSLINAGTIKPEDLGHVYDPKADRFYDAVSRKGAVFVDPRASSVCYTNSELCVWLNGRFLKTVERALMDPLFGNPLRRYPFVNGIWGSGKSFLAKQWFEEQRKAGREVLLLGSSRAPTDKIREDLYGDSPDGKRYVRTVGSVMANGLTFKPYAIVVDEVCMEHSAVVHVMDYLYKPEVFWVCGDFMQMEYVTFVAGLRAKFASMDRVCIPALLQQGHRAPADVYAAGLSVYGWDSGIHPCSCPEHVRDDVSFEVRRINSISEVPVKKGVKYLTYGQTSKAKVREFLETHGLTVPDVSTVAEFQGGTADEVYIVRDIRQAKKGTIYHEIQRSNVAMSRSVGKTIYFTTSMEVDALTRLWKESVSEANRDVVRRNSREVKFEFGLVELCKFVMGELNGNHPALEAGVELLKKRG